MDTNNLNLRKLQHVAGGALKNGIALHFDALLLYQHKSYGTALFVSVISMEEIGKAFWLDHYAWSSKDDRIRSDEDFNENDWMHQVLSNHRSKQLEFIRQVPQLWHTPLPKQIESKHLDTLKQNSIYVGLSKPNAREAWTNGRILSPKRTTKTQAQKQLKMVHDFLLDNIEGVRSGRISHDLHVIHQTFSETLEQRLSAYML